MRLLLIRHGQTPCNVLGQLDTAYPGAGLTPLGEAQAAAIPPALAHERIGAIFASPLTRTQLTAAPLAAARGLAVDVRPGLEEVSAGDYELRGDAAAVHAYAESLAHWMRGDLDQALPGGHNGRDFLARFDAAIARILSATDPSGTVAVFSHGAAIRAYTATRAGLSPDRATELRLANTGMSILTGSIEGGWALERWTTVPLGGSHLEDVRARDITGESVEEAVHDED